MARADQLPSLLSPDSGNACVDPCGSDLRTIIRSAHYRSIAVTGNRNCGALMRRACGACTHMRPACLRPYASSPCVDPSRTRTTIKSRPSYNRRIAVAGKRNRGPLLRRNCGTRIEKLASLLSPNPARSSEYPRRTGKAIINPPTHDCRIAVGGEAHGTALLGDTNSPGANELTSLLRPGDSGARKDPCGARGAAIGVCTNDGRIAVGGE